MNYELDPNLYELTSRKSGKESVTSLKVNGVFITNPMLSNVFYDNLTTAKLILQMVITI